MFGNRSTVPFHTRLNAARVVSNVNSRIGPGTSSLYGFTRDGHGGVYERNDLTAIEFGHQLIERRIPQVAAVALAREQYDPIEAQGVECVLELDE